VVSEVSKGPDDSRKHDLLCQRGKEFGIVFVKRTLKSNSKMALEAGEYARDMGKYESFHGNAFHAYFSEGLDIGKLDVISDVARKSLLDVDGMRKAIKDGQYKQRLDDVRREGRKINLVGVPTFIINDTYNIFGAQPVEVFKRIFSKIGL
jgi:predicted DsbA family dithiol-disulfide isomerase